MIFLNHALTGALLALKIEQPLVLVPMALGSHLVLDALPHYGYPELDLDHRRWVVTGIIDGVLTVGAVMVIYLAWPQRIGHILIGVLAAVLPDLVYIPQVLVGWQPNTWWHRLHGRVQWAEFPRGLMVDVAWAGAMVYLLWLDISKVS
jgi:hypothetical protein